MSTDVEADIARQLDERGVDTGDVVEVREDAVGTDMNDELPRRGRASCPVCHRTVRYDTKNAGPCLVSHNYPESNVFSGSRCHGSTCRVTTTGAKDGVRYTARVVYP